MHIQYACRVSRRLALVCAALLTVAVSACAHDLTAASPQRPRVLAASRTASVLDLDDPQIARLDSALRDALEAAATAASAEGVPLVVRSGWRSATTQERLLKAAVVRYGSLSEAERWVLPPDQSAHVRGGAVDIGPAGAAAWLEQAGNRWGLCRRYDNEYWHFELLTEPGQPCPPREPHAQLH